MFKKGQVVKSVITGRLYVVTKITGDRWLRVRALITDLPWTLDPRHLLLVGNNYKSKKINKALREVRA